MRDVLKIAVVDDDQGIRDALAGLISSLGSEPLCYESAEKFLASAERRDVACIIVDVRMPGMNGLDLQNSLNAEGGAPPIIFMTSYRDEHTRRRALTGGAAFFLGKPVEVTELIDCIHSTLSRRLGK